MSPGASSYLLLLLPGGIANQETSVNNSSDYSGVWAVINVRRLCNNNSGDVPLVRGSIPAADRVRRVRLRKSNYVKIIPTHMVMMREIIPGRQQMVRRCPL